MDEDTVDIKTISWKDIQVATDQLIEKIHDKIDVIIGVSRGGIIPATLMSYRMKTPLVSIGVKSYEGTTRTAVEIYQEIPNWAIVENKNLLIVDDISDSGETFKHILTYLNETGHKGLVVTAAPYMKMGTSHTPSVWNVCFPKTTWVVFPWEA